MDDLAAYDVFLRQKLDFPVIGNPENSLMEAEWFFDTNFHLNRPGKEVNTVQLIRDMKAMLGDDRAVTVNSRRTSQKRGERYRQKPEYGLQRTVRHIRVKKRS